MTTTTTTTTVRSTAPQQLAVVIVLARFTEHACCRDDGDSKPPMMTMTIMGGVDDFRNGCEERSRPSLIGAAAFQLKIATLEIASRYAILETGKNENGLLNEHTSHQPTSRGRSRPAVM